MSIRFNKKLPLISILGLLILALSYTAYASFFSQSTQAKGLVGHWGLGDEEEVLGAEKLTNGDFESGGSGNPYIPTGWANYNSMAAGEGISETSDVYGGTKAFRVTAGSVKGIYQIIASGQFTTGKNYRLSLWMKSISGTSRILLQQNYSINHVLDYSAPTTWTHFTYDFTSTGGDIAVYLSTSGIAGDNIYDNVSLKEIHAADATPNANHGAVYGASYTTDRHGQSNKAMSFDGTDDYIDAGSGSSLNLGTGGFTISAWIKMAVGADDSSIMGNKSTPTNNLGYGFGVYYDDIFFKCSNGAASQYIQGVTNVKDGIWHHVVLVRDSSNPKAYLDGKDDTLAGAACKTMDITNSSSLSIGSALSGEYFDGSLADVRIYNYALTAEEIKDLYGSYNPVIKASSLTKGLVGQWGLGDEEEVVGSELVTNGNMELDSEWTTVFHAVSTQSSDQAHSGTYSRKVVAEGGWGGYMNGTTAITSVPLIFSPSRFFL